MSCSLHIRPSLLSRFFIVEYVMIRATLAIVLTLGFAVDVRAQHHPENHPSTVEGHPLRGVVVQVLTEKKLVLVKHEEIPGFMKAMTMAFHVPTDLFPHLTAGTPLAATLLPKRSDGWHLTSVRVLAQSGELLSSGVPYRLTLSPIAEHNFAGNYAFTARDTGDWRACVSLRTVWIEVVQSDGSTVASRACTHANPEGFAKGPLYTLTATTRYALRLTKSPVAEVDLMILPFTP